MEYNYEKQTWTEKKQPNTMRHYYEKDRAFYDGLIWTLTAFMIGLVVGVGLTVGGVL